MIVFVRQNSWIARLAAFQLRSNNCAIVINRHIYLYHIEKTAFVQCVGHLRHELRHVEQWQQYGLIKFPLLYLFYSIRYGYYNNPFEQDARKAELDDSIIKKFIIQ